MYLKTYYLFNPLLTPSHITTLDLYLYVELNRISEFNKNSPAKKQAWKKINETIEVKSGKGKDCHLKKSGSFLRH